MCYSQINRVKRNRRKTDDGDSDREYSLHKEQPMAPLRNTKQFPRFCRLLGEELARAGHFLIVPCDNDRKSADWFCLQGFTKVKPDPSEWAVKAPSGHKGNVLPKGHIDAAREAQCVIIIGGSNGTYAAGMTAIYRRTLIMPVGCFGGAAEDLLNNMSLPPRHVLRTAVCVAEPRDILKSVRAIMKELNGHPRLLIVHGHGGNQDNVVNVLQKGFKGSLHNPVILRYSGNAAVTLPEKFAELADTCTGAIIIASPDDIGASVLDEVGRPITLPVFEHRARQNVWIEFGWLWARLSRARILLLLKGDTSVPSDLKGAVYEQYKSDPGELKDAIIDFVAALKRGPESVDRDGRPR